MTGRVTFNGPPEEESRFEFEKYPNSRFCRRHTSDNLVIGNSRILRTIEVGAHKGLKGAIVAVTDLLDEKFMAEYSGSDIVVENCSFSVPFTGVIVEGRSLSVENRDTDPNDPKHARGVLHSGHFIGKIGRNTTQAEFAAILKAGDLRYLHGGFHRTLYNVLLPDKGSRMVRQVKLLNDHEGSYVWLICDQHEFEQAFFLPVTNLYYAKVSDDGSFEIKGVPPGRHRIVAWHPYVGRAETDIVVDERGSALVNFELKKGKFQP